MITREKEPPNLEMPFGSLESFVTPTEPLIALEKMNWPPEALVVSRPSEEPL